jgi:hypothetical protein
MRLAEAIRPCVPYFNAPPEATKVERPRRSMDSKEASIS